MENYKLIMCVALLTSMFVCWVNAWSNAMIAGKGEINDRCQDVSVCRNFGYFCAQNRTCQCIPTYIPNKDRSKCVGLVGQKCKYDEHCVEGAFCMNQSVCKCKEGLIPDLDNYCSLTNKNGASRLIAIPALLLLFIRFNL